jgi:hypothetical protein
VPKTTTTTNTRIITFAESVPKTHLEKETIDPINHVVPLDIRWELAQNNNNIDLDICLGNNNKYWKHAI